MFVVMIRAILLYIVIVFGLRIMGKRQLGELQPAELVVTILISNIATLPLEDTNVPLLGGVIPILTLVCFEVLISAVTLKSKTARKIISGNPRMVIRDGKIDQQEMKNLRFSIDDLMEQLRSNGVFDVRDVSFAIVETTGSLSVYKRFEQQETTAGMLNLTPEKGEQVPPAVIISEGKICNAGLTYGNLRASWLHNLFKEKQIRPQDIFLMTCDRNADYMIIPKENKK